MTINYKQTRYGVSKPFLEYFCPNLFPVIAGTDLAWRQDQSISPIQETPVLQYYVIILGMTCVWNTISLNLMNNRADSVVHFT